MNENQVISSLLNEKKTALESLKKKIHQVETEIRVLEEAEYRLGTPKVKMVSNNQKAGRGRKLDDKWKQVLIFIGNQGKASLDEIINFIQERNYPISRSNLRVQLNSYTQKDWVRRIAKSTYGLTESGIEKTGCAKKPEPSVTLAETEGSNTEQDDDPHRTFAEFSDHNLGTLRKRRSYN